MNKERDSWERLITMQVLTPDSLYSPSRAKDGWYSATLRERLKGIEDKPTKAPTQDPLRKARRLRPDEMMATLPDRLGGRPRRNLRTRYIEVNERTISGNEGRHLYLELCNECETWTKETTTDALEALADRNPFDPIMDYLDGLECEPLPMEEWASLDQLLFNIEDPIAAYFMPRFMVSAVARVYEPGCLVRQLPVLVGPQNIGKTELGRALFGHSNFGDGLSNRLDVDDVSRLTRVWCLELGELDGITRRTQQEHFKAFISRRVDIQRRKYAAGEEDFPRRSVFWGTSNGAPLRDPTGSTRFVCIRVPDQRLPVTQVSLLRDAIWKRAIQAYRDGYQWYSTDEELEAIKSRNEAYVQLEPWAATITAYLDQQTIYPVTTELLFNRLKIEPHHQNNSNCQRIRQICEAHGWVYGQRRDESGKPRRGFWPAN
jgi:predicted P-loop ATPase